MEVPDLADAEKVLKNRIEQYEVRKRRGLSIDDDVKNDLEAIRKELHKWFSI